MATFRPVERYFLKVRGSPRPTGFSELKMLLARGLAVLAVSSLASMGGTYAASAANARAGGSASIGQKPPAVAKQATTKPAVAKPAVTKDNQPAAQPAGQAAEEAPIVMGRSVAVVRKSKLRHIKVKPAHPVRPAKP
jgi:hypothetical protein